MKNARYVALMVVALALTAGCGSSTTATSAPSSTTTSAPNATTSMPFRDTFVPTAGITTKVCSKDGFYISTAYSRGESDPCAGLPVVSPDSIQFTHDHPNAEIVCTGTRSNVASQNVYSENGETPATKAYCAEIAPADPVDDQGRSACPGSVGWGSFNGTDVTVTAAYDASEGDNYTVTIRRTSGAEVTKTATATGTNVEVDFDQVDPATVHEIVVQGPHSSCYALPGPDMAAKYPQTLGAH
ncbi:hypothetical protein QNM97_14050 [Gordonia sp. L191]|uniref:hypothetical protein n=1 Tax=Gordonia sp. L191 TaxID=2982699 RepID=UPI0024BFC789|nr:hypothetical protein [Gordonia sp. L191]WHU45175.1 hypothetical protein QNM97_14050 [Gordonia sp. L191]